MSEDADPIKAKLFFKKFYDWCMELKHKLLCLNQLHTNVNWKIKQCYITDITSFFYKYILYFYS